MPTVFLAHWNEDELEEREDRLRAAGHRVRSDWRQGGAAARAIRDDPPDALVVDLARLPSHGRSLARWVRETRACRGIPVVFVEGDPVKTERARREFPECVFTTWRGIRGAVRRALASPPGDARRPAPGGPSGTPLLRKLGVRPGSRLALLGAPEGFDATLGELPEGATVRRRARGACDVILLFARDRAELRRRLPAACRALGQGGGLWLAWPKKSSGVESDLSHAAVQATGLDAGLVDVKVCAVDGTWSALRFTRRRGR